MTAALLRFRGTRGVLPVCMLAALFVVGCASASGDPPANPGVGAGDAGGGDPDGSGGGGGGGDVVLAPEARMPETDPQLTGVEVLEDRLVFTYSAAVSPADLTYAVGDVLVGERSGGYLRRARGIDAQGTAVTVTTDPAVLTDVIQEGSVRTTTRAGAWERGGTGMRSDGLQASVGLGGVSVFAGAGQDVSVSLSDGSLSFDPEVRFEVDIEGARVRHVVLRASGRLALDVGFDVATVRAVSTGAELSLDAFHAPFATAVGPVPVVGEVVISFGVGAEVESAAETVMFSGLSAETTLDAGVEFSNGVWSTVWEPDLEASVRATEVRESVVASARLYVQPKVAIKLYGVVGPTLDVEPYAELRNLADRAEMAVGLSGHVGVEAGVHVLAWEAGVSHSEELFDWSEVVKTWPHGGEGEGEGGQEGEGEGGQEGEGEGGQEGEGEGPGCRVEECNGRDDDCDGDVDELLFRECGDSNEGQCQIGNERCEGGAWVGCNAVGPGSEDDRPCDGLDNDCDGQADEGQVCRCNDGDTRACGDTDEGECSRGVERCRNNDWSGSCEGEVGPSREQCNNRDDDCDGRTDEDLTQGCQTACGQGEETCRNGRFQDCDAPQPGAEVCNGRDDDCDGAIDEGVANDCGSCGRLRGNPGADCGMCGEWRCDGDDVRCNGDRNPNGQAAIMVGDPWWDQDGLVPDGVATVCVRTIASVDVPLDFEMFEDDPARDDWCNGLNSWVQCQHWDGAAFVTCVGFRPMNCDCGDAITDGNTEYYVNVTLGDTTRRTTTIECDQ